MVYPSKIFEILTDEKDTTTFFFNKGGVMAAEESSETRTGGLYFYSLHPFKRKIDKQSVFFREKRLNLKGWELSMADSVQRLLRQVYKQTVCERCVQAPTHSRRDEGAK